MFPPWPFHRLIKARIVGIATTKIIIRTLDGNGDYENNGEYQNEIQMAKIMMSVKSQAFTFEC